MADELNLSGNFLLAAPGLEDPNFSQTVVLVCEHSGEGAFGLIINRLMMDSIRPLSKALGLENIAEDLPVHFGGPVKPEQGYVLYSPFDERYGVLRVGADLGLTASLEILTAISEGRGPDRFLFALGFSGWTANQLEREIMEDSWLAAPCDPEIIFNAPLSERWRLAGRSIGVDFGRYVRESGNA